MPPLLRRFLRRTLTFPLTFVAAGLFVVSAPVALPLLGLADVLVRKRSSFARTYAFFATYLLCEVGAIVATSALWLASPLLLRGTAEERRERWEWLHVNLQSWWTRTLLGMGGRIFRVRMEVEGDEVLRQGPMLLLMRHSSVADTALPSVLVTHPHRIRLRYVLKRELLWDPALDLVGHRIPNYFVDRNAKDPMQEIEGVRTLVQDLRADEGVIIYPEGTVFDARRRRAALARVAAKNDPAMLARAEALKSVLPPRMGGALALLESNPGLDVVFGAHTGFEGAAGFKSLFSGSWLDATVRVRFWRVPFGELPKGREALREYLWQAWERMDQEVSALHARDAEAREGVAAGIWVPETVPR
ncbi:MAG: 1-acyl-sn-glycerol-3-phosphate acyltransferase [Polyangiales bacterium]